MTNSCTPRPRTMLPGLWVNSLDHRFKVLQELRFFMETMWKNIPISCLPWLLKPIDCLQLYWLPRCQGSGTTWGDLFSSSGISPACGSSCRCCICWFAGSGGWSCDPGGSSSAAAVSAPSAGPRPRRALCCRAWNEGFPKVREDFTITEKCPTKAFSWLKAPTSAFTFKTL